MASKQVPRITNGAQSKADSLVVQVEDIAKDMVSLYPKLASIESLPQAYRSPKRAESPWAESSYEEFIQGVTATWPVLIDAGAQLVTLERRIVSFADSCESLFPKETHHRTSALRRLDFSPKEFDKATLDNLLSASRHLSEIKHQLEGISAIAAADQVLKNAVKQGRIELDEEGRVVRASVVMSDDPLSNIDSVSGRRRDTFQLNTFTDLTLYFANEHRVQITCPGHAGEVWSFEELGFMDQRSKKKPIGAWDLLLEIARNRGRMGRDRVAQPSVQAFEKNVQKIRSLLRKFFGCQDNPIPWIKEDREYRAVFRVTISNQA